MKDLNTVMMVGRLTKDAEIRYTAGGMAIVSFSIANNSPKKDGDKWVDEASFFNVSYFGKPAEGLKQYLTKGKQVAVSGRLKQERWDKDGQPQSRVVINADDVQLFGGHENGTQGQYQNQPQQNGGYPQQSYPQNNGYRQPQNNGYQQNLPPQVQAVQQTFGGEAFQEDIPF